MDLALIRSPAAVPEERPLEGFVVLEVVLETKLAVLVGDLQETFATL